MKFSAKLPKLNLFSKKTFFEVLSAIFINLTSVWVGLTFAAPGLYKFSSFEEYKQLLTINLPFAIIGLIISLWLTQRSKEL